MVVITGPVVTVTVTTVLADRLPVGVGVDDGTDDRVVDPGPVSAPSVFVGLTTVLDPPGIPGEKVLEMPGAILVVSKMVWKRVRVPPWTVTVVVKILVAVNVVVLSGTGSPTVLSC